MAENYKLLYQQMKKIVTTYQDEVVPGLRELARKGPVYGNHIMCSVDKIQEAKELLLEQLIDMIRELAKKDDFWEVTSLLNADKPGEVIVAYKISIPHMQLEQEVMANYCEIAKYIESCEDCGFCNKT